MTMPGKDDAPATKGDLKKLGQELRNELATKDDLKKLRHELSSEMATKSDLKRVAIHVSNLESKLSDGLREIKATNSKLAFGFFSRIDAFMARTLKVETDQTFLIHRMDNLEGRVKTLESRPR